MNKLHEAIKSNDINLVKRLLNEGADIEEKYFGKGMTPLNYAISRGKDEVALYLIKKGANKEILLEGGATLLHRVICQGKNKLARCLIENGATMEVSCNGEMPLHRAILNGNNEIAKCLIDHGANIEALWTGDTPLHLAIFKYNNEIARYLIDKGANKEALSYMPYLTPLQQAIYMNNPEMAEYLIDQGALVNVKNREGDTLIHWLLAMQKRVLSDSLKKENIDLLKKLMYKCDLSLTNSEGINVSEAITKKGKDVLDLVSKENAALIFYPGMSKDRFAMRYIRDFNKKSKPGTKISSTQHNGDIGGSKSEIMKADQDLKFTWPSRMPETKYVDHFERPRAPGCKREQ